ncbi:hypothetical protein B0H21DRAFT_793094 [Amylocystis lapponica]|nr:hypothetical protein B0H21DRAFT_793094 [Amylocystis lapponica]
MEDDDIWHDDPRSLQDSEWAKLSSDFSNAGYREGITAGKESALQQGFDEGFAEVGAPLGRELGILRGISAALLSFLTLPGTSASKQEILDEARDIASQLGRVRFSDIAPPDLEAERHAHEHLDVDDDGVDPEPSEDMRERRQMEKLEDMITQMNAGTSMIGDARTRPSASDVRHLKGRLMALCNGLGMTLQWS